MSEDERLPQLFEHFGISPASEDAWQNLALALARKHVPGFSAVRERGAPVTRDAFVKYRLYKWSRRKKNALAGRGNVTQRQVCEALSRDRQFKTDMPELAKLSPKGLANTLSKALKMRRANVLHRWGVRATLRKIANLPQDEIAELSVGLFGDTPYWPGRVHRELKKPSR
ncbi:MAG TPA: hypothetical protein VGN97_15530 [Mesorhizobium sp.]|nr:hypothetical protein [Mesorhizobium sp.]